jgi:hypothetical protein
MKRTAPDPAVVKSSAQLREPEGLMEKQLPLYDRLFYPLCVGVGVSQTALLALLIWTLA